MDILIKNMEMPKDGCKDCRFHNYSIIRSENKYLHLCYVQCLAEKTETKEVVKLHEDCPLIPVLHCKDCDNFNEETDICTLWGSWTSEDGFCHKAFGVLERT